ncbi:MAG TPA: hypothetical protein VM324_14875 [Egibacteraceae bacterium]|jgi:hypothetical protein|nr:hypothetical protein [Egibacteraceae bacterium]
MLWGLIGLGLLLGAWWAWQWQAGRDAAARVRRPADPFVDRRAMVRYHAALRASSPRRR